MEVLDAGDFQLNQINFFNAVRTAELQECKNLWKKSHMGQLEPVCEEFHQMTVCCICAIYQIKNVLYLDRKIILKIKKHDNEEH